MAKKKKEKIKKYSVDVIRIGIGIASFDVKAPDKKTAKKLAKEAAANHLYVDHDAAYKVDSIMEQ